MRTTIAAALAAMFLSAPAAAQTPAALSCMQAGYSAEDQKIIDAYVANFSLDRMEGDDALATMLGFRAGQCVGDAADEDSMMAMIMYSFADLSLKGIAATRPDIVEVIGRIDTQLPADKRERFMGIFANSVFGGSEESGEQSITPEEDEFFSNTILEAPVNGSMEQAELIGAYLAGR